MRVILDTIQDDSSMVLMQDQQQNVYLIPVVLGNHVKDHLIGTIQYRVTDDEDCFSCEFDNLKDAINFFREVQQVGWYKKLTSTKKEGTMS